MISESASHEAVEVSVVVSRYGPSVVGADVMETELSDHRYRLSFGSLHQQYADLRINGAGGLDNLRVSPSRVHLHVAVAHAIATAEADAVDFPAAPRDSSGTQSPDRQSHAVGNASDHPSHVVRIRLHFAYTKHGGSGVRMSTSDKYMLRRNAGGLLHELTYDLDISQSDPDKIEYNHGHPRGSVINHQCFGPQGIVHIMGWAGRERSRQGYVQ